MEAFLSSLNLKNVQRAYEALSEVGLEDMSVLRALEEKDLAEAEELLKSALVLGDRVKLRRGLRELIAEVQTSSAAPAVPPRMTSPPLDHERAGHVRMTPTVTAWAQESGHRLKLRKRKVSFRKETIWFRTRLCQTSDTPTAGGRCM